MTHTARAGDGIAREPGSREHLAVEPVALEARVQRMRVKPAPDGQRAGQGTQPGSGRPTANRHVAYLAGNQTLTVRPRPKAYGRAGTLEVRLARGLSDVRRAQRLRYEVFYEELTARPSLGAQLRRSDRDPYDALCDHLLVVDLAKPHSARDAWKNRRSPKVVGTYRVLAQTVAEAHRGFYSAGEFDIAPLIAANRSARIVELGRSCVLKSYRGKRTVELLWHGLWTYVREHNYSAMIGCASFPGTDPEVHALALSFLHQHRLAPQQWRARAHDHLYVPMNRLPAASVDARAAFRAMPPLIKAYLRVGAFFGDGAVIDHQFGTTDVFVVMPVDRIDPRYFEHFGSPDEARSRLVLA